MASFVCPRIWNTIPEVFQNTNSLLVLKENIKKWVPENCPCRSCKFISKANRLTGFCMVWVYILNTLLAIFVFNPLSAKFMKWSNTLKQFVDKLLTNCLSVFDHFVGLALKGLTM